MPRSALCKLVRSSKSIRPLALRSSPALRTSILRPAILPIALHGSKAISIYNNKFFSTTRPSLKGLSPESENPQPTPREQEHNVSESASAPADITIERFHELADTYLEALIEKLEELQEETEEVDVEYSVRPPSHISFQRYNWHQDCRIITDGHLCTGRSPHAFIPA